MRGRLESIQERQETISRDIAVSWILSIVAVLLLAGWGM